MAPIDSTGKIQTSLGKLYKRKTDSVRTNDQSNSTASTNATRPTGQDQFILSPQSSEVNRIKQQLDEIPEVDEQKVAALRERVNNGTYAVTSQQVAEKILVSGIKLN
ncbi:MAG: flagellar biosynthesis anti-sigma factor FlgM [Candidatus Poribacteria bacterium]|nr:flagellar biosynthesis anti-sigma factor FlgM [Candidatus Poribacteria bacterium]